MFIPIRLVACRKYGKCLSPTGGKEEVAFLGDSITDKIHVGTTKNYWQYLSEMLGLEPFVYGINGHQWNGVLEQAGRLQAERGDDIDAILIFAGTNDLMPTYL